MVVNWQNYVIAYDGFAESTRLYMQHWIWNTQLGWNLHPQIKFPDTGPIHIADLGCGNGAWLLSLASSSSQDHIPLERTTFHGFDISSTHFPHEQNLPSNVVLSTLDAIAENIPEELVGKYDVVHIRMFLAVVRKNDPTPILRNALKMLKPGGYLQWDEMDGEKTDVLAPHSGISTSAVHKMLAALNVRRLLVTDGADIWTLRLAAFFEQTGFKVVDDQKMALKKELRKAMTDSNYAVYDHAAQRLVGENGCMPGSEKNWVELWTKAGEEIRNGVSMVSDFVVCVGQKAA